MSSRRGAGKKKETAKSQPPSPYKIPPREMMLTRTKSAQLNQKRQLRVKDRSMKKITQLLTKSPQTTPKSSPSKRTTTKPSPKTPKPTPTPPRKPEKPPETNQTPPETADPNQEFYPDKGKRKLQYKKIVLKPKTQLHKIGGTNKRKLNTPKQDSKHASISINFHWPPKDSDPQEVSSKNEPQRTSKTVHNDPYYGLSIAEAIRMQDETEDMTDEDFMAILTCPSPVWWEEHPEESDDEAISSARMTSENAESPQPCTSEAKRKRLCQNKNKMAPMDNETPIPDREDEAEKTLNVPEISQSKYDEKFLKKRSLLENLLGGIKSKKISDGVETDCDASASRKETDDDVVIVSSNLPTKRGLIKKRKTIKVVHMKTVQSPKRGRVKLNPGVILVNKAILRRSPMKKVDKITKFYSEVKHIKDRVKMDIEDSLLGNESVLKDLENIKIPIASEFNVNKKVKHKKSIQNQPQDCIVIDEETPSMSTSTNSMDNFLASGKDTHAVDPKSEVKVRDEDRLDGGDALSSPLAMVWTDNETGDKKLVKITSNCTTKEKVKVEEPIVEGCNDNDVPKELPPLRKFPKIPDSGKEHPINIASPKQLTENSESEDVVDSSSTVSGQEISDTISDTNIQFLTDDQILEDCKSKNDEGPTPECIDDNLDSKNYLNPGDVCAKEIGNESLKLDDATFLKDVSNDEKYTELPKPCTSKAQVFLKTENNVDPLPEKNEYVSIDGTNNCISNIDLDRVKTDEHIYVMIDAKTGKEEYLRIIQVLDDESKTATGDKDDTNNLPSENAVAETVKQVTLSKNYEDNLQQEDKITSEVHENNAENEETIESDVKHTDPFSAQKVKACPNDCNDKDTEDKLDLSKTKDIAEKYARILRRKFYKNQTKRKSENSKNNTVVDPKNERDVSVYIDIIKCNNRGVDNIENTENIPDNNNKYDTTYYCKQCNPNTKKAIIVSAKKSVNYCFKCSSIFDTNHCTYCLTNGEGEKATLTCRCGAKCCCAKGLRLHEISHGPGMSYACDSCSFRGSNVSQIEKHLWVHSLKNMKLASDKFSWDHCYA